VRMDGGWGAKARAGATLHTGTRCSTEAHAACFLQPVCPAMHPVLSSPGRGRPLVWQGMPVASGPHRQIAVGDSHSCGLLCPLAGVALIAAVLYVSKLVGAALSSLHSSMPRRAALPAPVAA
jgi:hypothetical protein